MSEQRAFVDPIDLTSSMQPVVMLLGTSLHFSEQLLRLLGMEFPEVRFERTCDVAKLFSITDRPNVVILHESVPDLPARVAEIGSRSAGTMIAVACVDPVAFRCRHGSDSLPAVSVLQINTQIDVWLSILRLLLCGHAFVPLESADLATEPIPPREADPERNVTHLTPRELQILPMIAKGLQNKMIASELGLSEHTVKLHTHNIYAKLNVSNRTGAANWYFARTGAPDDDS